MLVAVSRINYYERVWFGAAHVVPLAASFFIRHSVMRNAVHAISLWGIKPPERKGLVLLLSVFCGGG